MIRRKVELETRFEEPGSQPGPDGNSAGFLLSAVDPLRYDGQPNDPDEVVGVVSSEIPLGARVLDVGCGTGSVSIQIVANRRASLVGLEPDEMRARRARERGLTVWTSVLTADVIAQLGQFDVVLLADVLEHLPDPFSVLQLAKAALTPEGRIVASVPNVAHWSVRTELAKGRFSYRDCGIMDATHLRWFTEATLRLLFQTAGLTIESLNVTAGFDLQCYSERLPWRRMSRQSRNAVIRRALIAWPRLFGCQFVVRARRVAEFGS